tara:strand:+ start:13561 stop:14493 length:933 start_codon:yes stop_codon:yes gene_type:complete
MAEEMQELIVLQVEELDHCRDRLDQYLVKKLPEISRSRLQSLIRGGHVLVNDQAVKPKLSVEPGDRIEISFPPPENSGITPEEIPLDILFEDDDLIAINKAEGMVVHPAAGNPGGTLVNALLHHCKGNLSGIGGVERPGIVHRLDKDTSGCIIVAKNDIAHNSLSSSFAERTVKKQYICVVTGKVRKPSGRIENFIGRNPGNRQKMAIVDERHGRVAITEWTTIHEGEDFSTIRCHILTGRTHQIRVHMAYELGHAILGDPIYGKRTLQREDSTRLMLHAWQLTIQHPISGQPLELEAPLPADFARFLPT